MSTSKQPQTFVPQPPTDTLIDSTQTSSLYEKLRNQLRGSCIPDIAKLAPLKPVGKFMKLTCQRPSHLHIQETPKS